MTHLLSWLPPDTVHDLGWTLIHFLWQGLALAALLYAISPMCRTAQARHNWAVTILGMIALAPIGTFLLIHGQEAGRSLDFGATGTVSAESGVGGDVFSPVAIPVPWISYLVLLWLGGILILSLRALGGWYLAEELRHHDSFPLPADLLRRIGALKQRLAIAWPVKALQSNRVSVPAVIGWFRPVLLLPVSAITGLDPQQLDSLILHELAHIRRFDTFTNFMLITVETILFYHPAVWWVTRRIRIEREYCCDDLAVEHCGNAVVYAEALTALETARTTPSMALAAHGGKLRERIARLLGLAIETRRASLSATAGLFFLSAVIGTVATAQTTSQMSTPHFAIRAVDEDVPKDASQGAPGDDRVSVAGSAETLWLKRAGQIDGNVLAEGHVRADNGGTPVIQFTLTPGARDQFAEMTRENVGHRLAVVVNGMVITAPVVREPMLSGKMEISGSFKTEAEANAMLAQMMGTKPPSAITVPTPKQSARLKTIQLAQAVSACSDKAVDRDYWRCVNNFTSQRYGMHVGRPDDGSVTLVDDTRGPVRAPVGKPLQEAQALAAQKNYAAAMAKINEAEAVPNQTATEIRVTAEMKEYIAGVSSRPSQP